MGEGGPSEKQLERPNPCLETPAQTWGEISAYVRNIFLEEKPEKKEINYSQPNLYHFWGTSPASPHVGKASVGPKGNVN